MKRNLPRVVFYCTYRLQTIGKRWSRIIAWNRNTKTVKVHLMTIFWERYFMWPLLTNGVECNPTPKSVNGIDSKVPLFYQRGGGSNRVEDQSLEKEQFYYSWLKAIKILNGKMFGMLSFEKYAKTTLNLCCGCFKAVLFMLFLKKVPKFCQIWSHCLSPSFFASIFFARTECSDIWLNDGWWIVSMSRGRDSSCYDTMIFN